MVCRFRFFLLFLLLGGLVAFAFNNCGSLAPRPKRYTRDSVNKKQENYPWPNETTTLKDSNVIASEVLFSDIDADSIQEAVFFSKSGDSNPNLQNSFVLRLVKSGSFKEVKNISGLVNQPDSGTGMILIDVDLSGEKKELIYLSGGRQKIVVLDIVGDRAGEEQILFPVEPLGNSSGFSTKNNGSNKLVEIGSNIIFISEKQEGVGSDPPQPIYGSRLIRDSSVISIESALVSIDGGWGDFSDWVDWPNGSNCSKICGDGYQIRFRLCNQPIPRNGGAQCQATEIDGKQVMTSHKLDCRRRNCEEKDCDEYEILNRNTKNCDPNPDNPRPDPGGPCGNDGCIPGDGPNGPDQPPGPGEKCSSRFKGTILNNRTGKCMCPADTFWVTESVDEPQCFEPIRLNDIYLQYNESIWEDDEEQIIVHKYRISLSHDDFLVPGSNDNNCRDPSVCRRKREKFTADQYCVSQGYGAAINFWKGTYTSGSGTESGDGESVICDFGDGMRVEYPNSDYCKKAYVLCTGSREFGGNGKNMLSKGSCPVGDRSRGASFGLVEHSANEKVTYLETVHCRGKIDGFDP